MDEFFKSYTGRVLVSIIWGLGLAALFRKVCDGTDCMIVEGPDPSDISRKVFRYDGRCIKFQPYYVDCTKSK
jgi:hypothetical protein